MTVSVPQSFIDLFGAELFTAYQRQGAKLRSAVRVVSGVNGSTYRFPKLGAGLSTQKSRHGDVPTMNLAHDNVTATLSDHYAAELIDNLDEFKQDRNYRADYVRAAVMALGRKTDDLIIEQWETTANSILHGGTGLDFPKILQSTEDLNSRDVPMEQRFFVIGPTQLTELLQINEATNRDFIDRLLLEDANTPARWMGFSWILHSGLPLTTGAPDYRSCFVVHQPASGLAVGKDVMSTIERVVMKDAWLAQSRMSLGAVVIEDEGVIEVQCAE